MCLEGKDRNVWLNGLKKLNRRGVHIKVDGITCSEDNFDMLLGMPDDLFFYEACVIEDPVTRRFEALSFHRSERDSGWEGGIAEVTDPQQMH